MPVYLVSGKLGAGKSLACVGRIRDAVREGKRIATNLDLNLDKLFKPHAGKPENVEGVTHQPVQVLRLPDKPTGADLDAIGVGNASYDENKNGLLVLDELGSWLNAREWADKSRQGVIDWLIHSRKKGWDVYLIVQDVSLVDKQVRSALVDYLVTCRRFDRMRIPIFGALINFLTAGMIKGMMPRMHFGIVRYGVSPDAIVAERWLYTGTDLYAGYDTRQVFTATYDRGVYSVLPPWHTTGRYLRPAAALWLRVMWALLPCFKPDPPRARPPVSAKPAMVQSIMRYSPEYRWRLARGLCERGLL